jgi:hypothetical protein
LNKLVNLAVFDVERGLGSLRLVHDSLGKAALATGGLEQLTVIFGLL